MDVPLDELMMYGADTTRLLPYPGDPAKVCMVSDAETVMGLVYFVEAVLGAVPSMV